jgi:hypothetical protein
MGLPVNAPIASKRGPLRAPAALQAPYDPSLAFLFFGEEMLQLVRMWRTGWDVFAPSAVVAFHLWSRGHRNTFQKDSLEAHSSGEGSDTGQGRGAGGGMGGAASYLAEGLTGVPAAEAGTHIAALGRAAVGSNCQGSVHDAAFQRQRSQRRVLAALGRVPEAPVLQHAHQGASVIAAGHRSSTSQAGLAVEEGQRRYVRSLDQFYEHCGVDFRRGVLGERARWGGRAPEEFTPSWQDLLVQRA